MRERMLSGLLISIFAAAAQAQQQGPPAPEPETKPEAQQGTRPAPKTSPKPGEKPPTLDDLLNLEPERTGGVGSGGTKPRTAPGDPAKAELERKLSNAEVSDQFLQAVRLMDETAQRLENSRDTGISTQRMQEDVVRKLDVLIAQAEKQQRQSKSRSRSRNNQDPQQQPDQQQQQQQAQQQQQQNSGQNQGERDPPGRRDGELGPGMAQGAAWGALPERMRDALLQGNADKFSSIWGPLTEAYYRKLAEEAGR